MLGGTVGAAGSSNSQISHIPDQLAVRSSETSADSNNNSGSLCGDTVGVAVPSITRNSDIIADSQDVTLGNLTKAISGAALTSGTGYKPGSFTLPTDDPDILELQALTRMRSTCRDPFERHTLSMSIFKIRRRGRARRSHLEYLNAINTGRAPFSQKKMEKVYALKDYENLDILLDDPSEILENVEHFYTNLYNTRDPLPRWIREEFDNEILEKLPVLDRSSLRVLISEMPKGKTGAEDLLVIEMLADLPDDLLDLIIHVFTLRMLNGEQEEKNPWENIVANLIEKKSHPETVKEFRPIALIPVLGKLYSKVLLYWATPFLKPLEGPQFAFRKNSSHMNACLF